MANQFSESDPVIDLVNDYLERYRLGEKPTVREYVAKYPELADQINEVFPMMLLMENNVADASEIGSPGLGSPAAKLERLGDFRVIREIGRGGMGIVYEAVQESLGRHVALKVFPTHSHLNRRHQERFRRESRSAAMLHHTNIVPVFAVGDEDGMLYYVMQYIRGAGLDEVISELQRLRPLREKTTVRSRTRLQTTAANEVAQSLLTKSLVSRRQPGSRDEPTADNYDSKSHVTTGSQPVGDSSVTSGVHLPGQADDSSLSETGKEYWQSIARIGVQVAQALEYAHEQGTLHRDIKPSNLLLDQDANVWVTDFGLAKSLEQDDLTHTGELIGTLRYMPPEQFSGTSDERSDLYSLGLTLYELLALRPAFDMPDRQRLIRAITASVPPRPRKLNPRIPRDLETIVLKTIEREPARRYQTAGELAGDLTRFLKSEPLLARPASSTERVIKWAKRRPAIASLLAALAIMFCISFALVTWKWREAETARAAVKDERDDARRAEASERNAKLRELAERKRKEELLEESEQNLYYSLLAQADFQRLQNDINAAKRTLDRAPENYRDWEWHYLKGQLNLDLMTLDAGTEDASWIRAMAFSRDGRFLATGSSLPLFVNARAGAPGAARIWDLATGSKIADFGDNTKSITGLAFSPDGKQIAISEIDLKRSNTGLLRIWDIASQTELLRMIDDSYGEKMPPNVDLQFSPDGSLLIAKRRSASAFQVPDGGVGLSGGDELKVWDALSGQQLWQRRITNVSFEFTSDGSRISTRLVGESDHTWAEFDARSGKVLKKTQQPIGYDVGEYVVDWGSPFRIIDKSSGVLQYTLSDPLGKLGAFAFRPDGKQLATASLDGSIRLWGLEKGDARNVLRGHSTQLLSVQYSPDGQFLASGDWDGNVKVWHLVSANEYVSNLTGQVEDIAFRFGDRALVTARYPAAIQTWDVRTGERLSQRSLDVYIKAGMGPARQVAFDGSGSQIAGAKNTARTVVNVWDVETGQAKLSLHGHENLINLIAFSDNGQRVASAAGNFPRHDTMRTGKIKVWDVTLDPTNPENNSDEDYGDENSADRLLLEIANPGQRITALALSDDGKRLAVAGFYIKSLVAGESRHVPLYGIWNIETGEKLSLPDIGADIHGLAFSKDGNRLAAADYGTGRLHLYDANLGTEMLQFHGPTGVQQLAFSPDGTRLAGVTRELTTLWDASNGREVITLRAKRKESDSIFNPTVRFSSDGRHLASTQYHRDYSFLIRTSEEDEIEHANNNQIVGHRHVNARSQEEALNERLALLHEKVRAQPDDFFHRFARCRVLSRLGDVKALDDYEYVKSKRFARSMLLTKAEHIRLPHFAFEDMGSFTLEAWVKDWKGVIAYQGYGYQGSQGYAESTVQFGTAVGTFHAGSGAGGSFPFTRKESFVFRFGKTDLSTWTHLAIVYDDEGNETRCYTNGQLSDTREDVFEIGPYHPDRPFWIGNHPTVNESKGQLRSFRMTQRARYTDDFVPDEDLQADADVIVMLDFTDRDFHKSTRITDLSGAGNHGELVGAWWLPNAKSSKLIAEIKDPPSTTLSKGTRELWTRRLSNINAIVDQEPDNGWYRLSRSKIVAKMGDHDSAYKDYLAAVKKINAPRSGILLEAQQYVEAPHIPFDQYESFTVETWVNNWSQVLVWQADALQPGFIIDHLGGSFVFREEGESGYRFANSAEYAKHAYRFKFHTERLEPWTHLAMVRNGDRLLSFVNGRLISEVKNVPRAAPLNRDQMMWIGGLPSRHYQAAHSGHGTLGFLRISDSARYVEAFTPDEQLEADQHTILLYDFSKQLESHSGRVEDLSNNGNHGKLYNAWWLE